MKIQIIEGKKRKVRKWPVRAKMPRRKAKYRGSKPSIKKKINSLRKADKAFSEFIRERDGKCLFPGCKQTDLKKLQCSHYFGRVIKNTRFDPDNCITLCWFHHYKSKDLGFEYQKQMLEKHGFDGQYTLFMQKWLGEERWVCLVAASKLGVKEKKAIERFYFSLHNAVLSLSTPSPQE